MTVLAPVRLTEAADSLAKASTPEPFSKSKTSNWVARTGGLPPYVQHIAHDIHEKRGKTESEAIQLAIGIVKNPPASWDANAKAACAKAAAEWEAKKGANKAKGAAKVSESKRRASSISLVDRVALRSAAKDRLKAIEDAFGLQVMVKLTEAASTKTAWKPELKRTASAGSEGERLEVHHEGQMVGTVASRRGYAAAGAARPVRWNAKSVNGRMVSDTEDSKEAALDGLRKHLEEAPARVAEHTDGKWLVAEPESYGGQVKYGQYPSQAAARYAAGLPEKETAPERSSKVVQLGECILFDVTTLSLLEETLPDRLAPLAEFSAFDEAKHPRGPQGKFAKGDRVNFQHSHFGRVPAKVSKVDSRRVHLTSSDPRVRDTSMTHKQAEERLSKTTAAKSDTTEGAPSKTAAQNIAAYERNRLSSVTARKPKTVLNPTGAREFRSKKGKVKESVPASVLGSLLEGAAQRAG